jgi:DNA-binding NtrC family response regulator
MGRVLIVDDEARLGRVLAELLEGHGYDVEAATSATEALARLAAAPADLVLTDLRMPDGDGLSLLQAVKQRAPGTDVIIMTAYATTEGAVEAMRQGAVDYLIKPFAMDELRLRVGRVMQRRALAARASALAERLERREGFSLVVAESREMRAVVAAARQVAGTDATVLLLGESGTGKTLLARAIHHASPRAGGPLIEANPAALPETLIESELFGHERGAFTGAQDAKVGLVEAAVGGTLFLDEIGELAPAMQVKLLHFLQDRSFVRLGSTQARRADVRVIAATNRDLKEAMRAGSFREDLYYRLSVFPIEVPPLRARIADVHALAVEALAERGVSPDRLSLEAMVVLERHPWPGNARELDNAIARAVILAGAGPILPEHLPAEVRGAPRATNLLDELLAPGFSLDALERELVHHAIARSGGNKAAAARLLGITRRRLYSRLKSLESLGTDEEGDEG